MGKILLALILTPAMASASAEVCPRPVGTGSAYGLGLAPFLMTADDTAAPVGSYARYASDRAAEQLPRQAARFGRNNPRTTAAIAGATAGGATKTAGGSTTASLVACAIVAVGTYAACAMNRNTIEQLDRGSRAAERATKKTGLAAQANEDSNRLALRSSDNLDEAHSAAMGASEELDELVTAVPGEIQGRTSGIHRGLDSATNSARSFGQRLQATSDPCAANDLETFLGPPAKSFPYDEELD